MDLFDLDYFYSRQVPMLALYSPLIMFSACAFSARQLSLTSRPRPRRGSHHHAYAEQQEHATQERDYTWIAEAYYDAAISLLRQYISDVASQDLNPASTTAAQESEAATAAYFDIYSPTLNEKDFSRARLHDDIVVAAMVLSNYEFLAGAAPNWSDHLDGTRSFLRLSDEAGLLDFAPPSPIPDPFPGPSRLRRSCFWNFARQDMLSAREYWPLFSWRISTNDTEVIHGKKTRLETDDVAMWQRMGLDLDVDGRLRDKSLLTQKPTSADRVDMISNTMIWMLGRLVNLIATCHEEMETDSADPARTNTSSERGSFLERWLALKHELQIWHDALPPLFQPCTRVPLPQRSTRHGIDRQLRPKPLVDHETWHSDSMCASTMQSWHMSQIMLLLHKPPSVSVRQLPWIPKTQPPNRFPDTLADFNQMNEMLQYHSVEICAIALSHPEEATRIHMLQPLYMAGRCLTDVSDRRTVVRLIDGIEDELGWHAKYRADALLAEWDTSRDTLEYYYETA